MNAIIRYLHPKNYPEVIECGPSALTTSDRLGKGLGWMSLALGAAALFAGGRIAAALGLETKSNLVRLIGAREIASGILTLSPDRTTGLWTRVAGDVMDVMLVATALDAPPSRQRDNAKLALAAVAGIAVLDVVAAIGTTAERRRIGEPKNFAKRSGFPRGVDAARGSAKDFDTPRDMGDQVAVGG
jgi:hypothetical protein